MLATLLAHQDIFNRRLKVDVAYHSPSLKTASIEYEQSVGSLEPGHGASASAYMVSSVTGEVTDAESLCNIEYWVENMLRPVRFFSAISKLCCPPGMARSNNNLLIELGPHSTLQGPIRDTLATLPGTSGIAYDSPVKRSTPADKTFLNTLGNLWELWVYSGSKACQFSWHSVHACAQ
jgi:acyl transferase domain-containing protein